MPPSALHRTLWTLSLVVRNILTIEYSQYHYHFSNYHVLVVNKCEVIFNLLFVCIVKIYNFFLTHTYYAFNRGDTFDVANQLKDFLHIFQFDIYSIFRQIFNRFRTNFQKIYRNGLKNRSKHGNFFIDFLNEFFSFE